ncbi:DMT family transporter [Roseiflexus sp.]|uniref:DMT family transporter n=1 Tax=Roseiflexus sp. TaxID=2562120 RepID=UPI00398B60FE
MDPRGMLLLFGAIICELIGTNALKAADGFTRLLPTLLVIAGYGASFYLMSLSLRTIPLGIAYAIWSGLGTAIIAVIGVIVWREHLNSAGVIGIVLIIVGVVLLNMFGGSER